MPRLHGTHRPHTQVAEVACDSPPLPDTLTAAGTVPLGAQVLHEGNRIRRFRPLPGMGAASCLGGLLFRQSRTVGTPFRFCRTKTITPSGGGCGVWRSITGSPWEGGHHACLPSLGTWEQSQGEQVAVDSHPHCACLLSQVPV